MMVRYIKQPKASTTKRSFQLTTSYFETNCNSCSVIAEIYSHHNTPNMLADTFIQSDLAQNYPGPQVKSSKRTLEVHSEVNVAQACRFPTSCKYRKLFSPFLYHITQFCSIQKAKSLFNVQSLKTSFTEPQTRGWWMQIHQTCLALKN